MIFDNIYIYVKKKMKSGFHCKGGQKFGVTGANDENIDSHSVREQGHCSGPLFIGSSHENSVSALEATMCLETTKIVLSDNDNSFTILVATTSSPLF